MPADLIYVWRGVDGRSWYWRRVAANGRGVAIGGEAYARRWNARRAAKRANPDRANWTWATDETEV